MRTDDNLGIHLRVFAHQFSNHRQSLVVFIRNREQNLKIRVFLTECGLQVLEQVGIQPFERS